MTREKASAEATEIAERDGVDMVVARDPYSEEPDDAEKFEYYPASAASIFVHHEIVERIGGDGNEKETR